MGGDYLSNDSTEIAITVVPSKTSIDLDAVVALRMSKRTQIFQELEAATPYEGITSRHVAGSKRDTSKFHATYHVALWECTRTPIKLGRALE